MNPIELALFSWKEQKTLYQKQIKTIINDLTKPLKCIPTAMYETKLIELKQYLKYNYTYEEDQGFNQIYVHHIAGIYNESLMELANRLVESLGGTVNFWKYKITDLAAYTNYHPELSIWEINRAYENYMGLSPQYTNNLRKKKVLAKNYLLHLQTISKLIDKSTATEEDLLKIDQYFQKLKKVEEKYYAFVEQIEDVSKSVVTTISTKGKINAKNSLFMFLKPKEEKVNTLINYNFKVTRQEGMTSSKLLKGKQYEQFDKLFLKLMRKTNQRQSTFSDTSQSNFPGVDNQTDLRQKNLSISDLQSEFKSLNNKKQKQNEPKQLGTNICFIWSKQFFFSYWGFTIKPISEMMFTSPFKQYQSVNYEIDSQQQFDQLNAEDVEGSDEASDEQSISNGDSFVVDDDYRSDEEQQKDQIVINPIQQGRQIWIKQHQDLKHLQIICLCNDQKMPLNLEEQIEDFDEKFIEKVSGKGRNEILSIFQNQKKQFSKTRIDSFLRNNFKKIRNKSKQMIYVKNQKVQADKITEINPSDGASDAETTSQNYQISVNYVSKSKLLNQANTTILQQPAVQDK